MRQFDIIDRSKFEFTRNWFLTRNYPTFVQFVKPEWSGKPITYLELGVFEGMSMVWMLQHVLTHPNSKAVGVDPWLRTTKLDETAMGQVKQRAFANIGVQTDRRVGEYWDKPFDGSGQGKCELYRANSAELLRRMIGRHGFAGIKSNSVDISMVDGNHNALAVWDDCRLVWQLLRPGGWMLLDDVVNDIPKVDHVREGLDLFLAEAGHPVELVWKHRYMECYRKCEA